VENHACYDRLKKHGLINYYNHAQANPYTWGALGDVKYVWQEFTEFQKRFCCFSCSKLLKYDRNEKKLYCTCGKQAFPEPEKKSKNQ